MAATSLVQAANQTLTPPPPEPVTGYQPGVAQAKEATSSSYTPQGVVVDGQDTVQGQLKTILDSGSPLMEQARTRAAQNSQARGVRTSTLADEAAQKAMVETALPIAQQDASTYFTGKTKTVDAQNAALNFGAAGKNQAELANAQLTTDVSKANAGMISEAGKTTADAANAQMLARLDANTRLQLGQLDATTKTALATLDAQNRALLQASQGAQQLFNQAITDITNISTNQFATPEAKNNAVQAQINMLKKGLEALQRPATLNPTTVTPEAIESLDLSGLFDDMEIGGTAATPGAQAPTGAAQFKGTQQVNQGNFDGDRYMADNPDVAQAGWDPWQHYLNYGQKEGRNAYSR